MQNRLRHSSNGKDNISHHDGEHVVEDERSVHKADASEAPSRSRRSRPDASKRIIGKLSEDMKPNEKEQIKQLRLELERLEKLPAQSAFAEHRRKMVEKALYLITIARDQRTSEESESLAQLIGKLKFLPS